jgi:hypothetical protein
MPGPALTIALALILTGCAPAGPTPRETLSTA